MLRVSKLTDYATVVLAQMAKAPAEVHTAPELAQRTHLARPTVSKLLKQLARGGLLNSYRGAHGGYLLAWPPDQITAARIIDTVEGPVAMTECGLDGHQCELEHVCQVGPQWQQINRAVRAALEGVSLADLASSEAIPLRPMDLQRAVTGEQVNG